MEIVGKVWSNVGKSNVCAVDYSRLANYGYLIASTIHARQTADHIAEFIKFLNQLGIPLDNISLAGHSLGAQVIAQVGASFNGQIGTIYGKNVRF